MQYAIIQETPDTCREHHASTDVYCVEQRRARVRYPLWLIGGLIAAGVIAFVHAGFVGYVNCTYTVGGVSTLTNAVTQSDLANGCWHDPWYNVLYLREPWPLFLWLSALMIVVQVSILRNHLRRLVMTLIITLASILVVAVVYLLGPKSVVDFLLKPPNGLLYQPLTYTVLNFGIIIAFMVDSVRRWIGYRKTELNPNAADLRAADPSQSIALKRAKIGELVSGDLIAGMILCGVLSIIFTDGFLRTFLTLTTGNTFGCAVGATPAPHGYPCPLDYHPHDGILYIGGSIPILSGHYITLVDSFLAGLCFVPGVAVLANTAFLRGLNPLAATRGAAPASHSADETDAGDVTAEVGMAVLDALREALARYILPYARRAIISLRNILWPLLILIGSFSFALCGRYIQYYLHHDSPTHACNPGLIQAVQQAGCGSVTAATNLELATIFAVVGFLSTIFSAALLMLSSRLATNSLRLMLRVGLVVLLTWWMFALAFFGFNWFLLDAGIVPGSLTLPAAQAAAYCQVGQGGSWQLMLAPPHPECAQPFSLWWPWTTAVSFAALLVALVVLALRMRTTFAQLAGSRQKGAARPAAPAASR